MRRPSPWAVLSAGALVLALAGMVSEFRNPVGGDPASLLYGAGRILDGARLYTDLIDLNPPFTFLFHTLPVAASRVLRLESILCFRVFVCGIIAVSGITLLATLRRAPVSAGTWHAFVAAFLLGSLGLVVGFFGEREHLQLVLVFPYLTLASLRALGHQPSRRLVITCGVLAGIGLALKVTAGMVPAFVLLILWFGARQRSDESLWALGSLGICSAVGLAWAPGYLGLARELGPFYRGFSGAPAITLLRDQPAAWMCGVALCAVVITGRAVQRPGPLAIWGVAVLGFLISMLVQGKGFLYHYLPATFSALALVLLLMTLETRRPSSLDALRRAVALAVITMIVCVPLAVAYGRFMRPLQGAGPLAAESYAMLGELPAGTSVAIESSRLGDAFPLVLMHDLRLAGRFPHLWFLYPYDSAASQRAGGVRVYTDASLTELERGLRQDAAEDLAAARPSYMLVRNSGQRQVLLRYLCDDSLFSSAARDYRLVRSDTVMQLFRRDTSTLMQGAGACASL